MKKLLILHAWYSQSQDNWGNKFVLCPGKGHFSKELNGVTEVPELLDFI